MHPTHSKAARETFQLTGGACALPLHPVKFTISNYDVIEQLSSMLSYTFIEPLSAIIRLIIRFITVDPIL